MSRFHRLRYRLPAASEELLTGWLWAMGVEGISTDSADDGQVVVDATFWKVKLPVNGGLEDLATLVPGLELLEAGPIEETDWLAAWREAAEPILLGERLLVDPREWEPAASDGPRDGSGAEVRAAGAAGSRFVLRIPARTAFGIGSHESTRLAYELLERTELSGRRVLDVGCGSGILAMAALQLGAGSAVGFDFDPAAALLAGQYARHNGVAPGIFAGTIAALGVPATPFEVVVLNVLPHEIADELGEVVAQLAPDGELLVSGVLAVEAANVVAVLANLGCVPSGDLTAGEWVGLRFRKRSAFTTSVA